MKTLESSYSYLPKNVEHRLVSGGVNTKTSVESLRIESQPIPIERIERNYMQNCDTLAGIFDGSITESENFMDGEARHDELPVEHAIYLDKSARPVHLLMRKTWEQLSDGKFPHASYRNIDKHNWIQLMPPDTLNPDAPDVSRISFENVKNAGAEAELALAEQIARLRATYLKREDLEKVDESNIVEDVWRYPTILDGKRVAIVDEVKSSGATLKTADILLQAAIPEAKFEPVYWSTPGVLRWDVHDPQGNRISHEFMVRTVPVWYDNISSYGRGIRDLDPMEALQSRSKKQRLGAFVLSRPYINGMTMDERSIAIRNDLEVLAERFLSGDIDYVPSGDREDKDFESRVERYHRVPYVDWVKQRRSRRRVA